MQKDECESQGGAVPGSSDRFTGEMTEILIEFLPLEVRNTDWGPAGLVINCNVLAPGCIVVTIPCSTPDTLGRSHGCAG